MAVTLSAAGGVTKFFALDLDDKADEEEQHPQEEDEATIVFQFLADLGAGIKEEREQEQDNEKKK